MTNIDVAEVHGAEVRNAEIIVVGAGIFGVTAALELRARDRDVLLIDAGAIPHPLAASTDISKVVRMEYGSDVEYMELVRSSIAGWQRWNEAWRQQGKETLYHPVGVTLITSQPLRAGDFEYESYHNLLRFGLQPLRLDGPELGRRYPAWNADHFIDGLFNSVGGFVESGRVVAALTEEARRNGVRVAEQQRVLGLETVGSRVTAVTTAERQISAEHVVVCGGAWTPTLVPELRALLRSTGHPVFHLRPRHPERYQPPQFTVFTADISRTGWYGFPLHPTEKVVKIANHGVGRELDPDNDERVVGSDDIDQLRSFLRIALPDLANDPIVYTRRCLYSDTADGHLWIDRHPHIENLTVAAGGSGHAMKMAPILGAHIAAAVEGTHARWSHKFRWRQPGSNSQEEARHQ